MHWAFQTILLKAVAIIWYILTQKGIFLHRIFSMVLLLHFLVKRDLYIWVMYICLLFCKQLVFSTKFYTEFVPFAAAHALALESDSIFRIFPSFLKFPVMPARWQVTLATEECYSVWKPQTTEKLKTEQKWKSIATVHLRQAINRLTSR